MNWDLQVLEGSSKALPVRSPSEASKNSPLLTLVGRPAKRALPSMLVPTSRSSLWKASVSHANLDLSCVNRLAIRVVDGEVGRAGTQSAVYDRNGMRVRLLGSQWKRRARTNSPKRRIPYCA